MSKRYLNVGEIDDILTKCETIATEVEPINSIINYDSEASLTVSISKGRKCPHCGESYYMENHSTCTAMYFPPIYKDGVNINPDRNIITTYCTCMNCGTYFSYNSNGEVKVIDLKCNNHNIINFTDEDVKNTFA